MRRLTTSSRKENLKKTHGYADKDAIAESEPRDKHTNAYTQMRARGGDERRTDE
jgi:hypothetical protein